MEPALLVDNETKQGIGTKGKESLNRRRRRRRRSLGLAALILLTSPSPSPLRQFAFQLHRRGLFSPLELEETTTCSAGAGSSERYDRRDGGAPQVMMKELRRRTMAYDVSIGVAEVGIGGDGGEGCFAMSMCATADCFVEVYESRVDVAWSANILAAFECGVV